MQTWTVQVVLLTFIGSCYTIEDVGTKHNGTIIRYATYHVEQMYQACPPSGRTVIDKWTGSTKPDKETSEILKKLSQKLEQTNKEMEKLKVRQESLEETVEKLKGKDKQESDQCVECRSKAHKVKSTKGKMPRDCGDVYDFGARSSGVYEIQPQSYISSFLVYCEITRTEGWTVIMARFNGSVSFYNNWAAYKKGFGSVFGEHWLGNEHIFQLTNQKKYKLRVDLTFWTGGDSYSADYSTFKIESEPHKYKLHVGGYSGNSGYDGLTYHNGGYFSTPDKDNDAWSSHCSQVYKGAFWYNKCHYANPTGLYQYACTGSQVHKCMEWARKPTKTMIFKVAPKPQ